MHVLAKGATFCLRNPLLGREVQAWMSNLELFFPASCDTGPASRDGPFFPRLMSTDLRRVRLALPHSLYGTPAVAMLLLCQQAKLIHSRHLETAKVDFNNLRLWEARVYRYTYRETERELERKCKSSVYRVARLMCSLHGVQRFHLPAALRFSTCRWSLLAKAHYQVNNYLCLPEHFVFGTYRRDRGHNP